MNNSVFDNLFNSGTLGASASTSSYGAGAQTATQSCIAGPTQQDLIRAQLDWYRYLEEDRLLRIRLEQAQAPDPVVVDEVTHEQCMKYWDNPRRKQQLLLVTG